MSKSQNPTKEVIPIMKKRIYRRMPVNDFQPDTISHADLGGKLVIAIDNQQNHAVYVGPAYSYYEFTSRTRLTDEEWSTKMATTPPPGFTAGFVIPPTKRSMVYPPKAPNPDEQPSRADEQPQPAE